MIDSNNSEAQVHPEGNYPRVTTMLHQAARAYATNGVAIFPCRPRDKRPLTGNGFHDATTDLDQIDTWWTDTPDANIGVALGVNNVFALDVDGPAGRAVLTDLEDTYAPLPPTLQVVTGRAEGEGRHYIFRQPDGDHVRNRQIGDHLETRGDGGYVIAAPSVHPSGAHYTAEGRWDDITEAPGWLLKLATRDTPTPVPADTLLAGGADQHAEKRLRGLAGNLALMPPDSGRNNTLNHAAYTAGQLVGAGRLDRQHAEDVLTTAAHRAGLTPAEIAATITSGLDAGTLDPDHDRPVATTPLPAVTVLDTATATAGETPSPFDQMVQQEVVRILARDRARDVVAQQQLDEAPLPGLIPLPDFLAQPDPEITYRIEGLWPADGRCLLAAQYKAGKTTTVGNILRCLADGEPLFGVFPVTVPDGRIVLFDDELHENTLRRWLRDQGIVNDDRIDVVPLRGKLSTFNILDQATLQSWAEQINAADASVVILDCLRPIIDALGLSEDKDVGKVLTAFDELLETAGVSEGLIVHHMGHHGERSRGDSRLRDWPDAEWKIVREKAEEGEDDPTAPRFFSAMGRDVEVPEQALALDPDGRRLTIVGGSRRDTAKLAVRDAVVQAVIDQPGIGARDLRDVVRDAIGRRNEDIDLGRQLALDDGLIETRKEGRAVKHFPLCARVPDRARHTGTYPVTTLGARVPDCAPTPGTRPEMNVPRAYRGHGHIIDTHDDTETSEQTGHTTEYPDGSQEVPL